VSSWASTLLLCIPLRYGASIEEPLGISLLLALWTTTQTLQTTIRRDTLILARLIRPKLRIALSVACNPVLWTALGLVAYAKAEQHRSHRPIDVVLSTLERNTTFTDLIMHRTHPSTETYINFRLVPSSETENPPAASWLHRPTPAIAAGDVANAILSAGLVCWGLKLWEYRRRLLSSAGLTILLVSCAAAAGNVVLGPLLARRMLGSHGAQPGYDLAFAARTVTLALGAPAVARLGGDVGLNAAMVVVNGIMFQMLLGLGAGGWLLRVTGGLKGGLGGLSRRFRLGFGRAAEPDGTAETGDRGSGRDGVVTRSTSPARVVPHSEQGQQATTASAEPRNTTTIASGVTVGINAAAMGTAHLYEAGSDAAPYAALAMTIFGVATVGFTMIPQLGGWVAAAVQ
jgi:putative effector of murein hydrolase